MECANYYIVSLLGISLNISTYFEMHINVISEWTSSETVETQQKHKDVTKNGITGAIAVEN
jgi:hypothetical protein